MTIKDTFQLQTRNSVPIRIKETNIAWSEDIHRFKNHVAPGNWIDMSNGTVR